MSGRIESFTTSEAPRKMLARKKPKAPICQFDPVAKKMSDPESAPSQAKTARRRFLLAVRSAMGPMSGRTTAEMIVEMVTRYDGSEPGATEMPISEIRLSIAASLAMAMM